MPTSEHLDRSGHADRSGHLVRDHLVAAAWGAAEATFLPLVPDVWISRVALRRPGRALATTLSATAGALAGGVLTHAWGRRAPAPYTAHLLARLPSVSEEMIAGIEADLDRDGLRAMLAGPVRGRPYKIYARTAGVRGTLLAPFLAWSVPARMPRLVVLALAPGGLAAAARRVGMPDRAATGVHAAAWVVFYAWYFSTVGRPAAGERDSGIRRRGHPAGRRRSR